MADKFQIVKMYIDQMDHCDLLASGAPSDEFDIESNEICAKIRYNQSVYEIAEIIASVFNEFFDEHNDASVYLTVAEQIKNELPK